MRSFFIVISFVTFLLIGAGCSTQTDDTEQNKETKETSTEEQQENSTDSNTENETEEEKVEEESTVVYEISSGYVSMSTLSELPDLFPDIPIPEDAAVEGILENEVGGSKTVTVMYKLDGNEIARLGEEYKNYLEGSGFSSISYDDFEHTIKIIGFDEDMNMLVIQLYVEDSVISGTISFKVKLEE